MAEQDKLGRNNPGRPTGYRPEYAEQAAKLAKLGATDAEIADFFEVNRATLLRWKAQYAELSEAMIIAKAEADQRVEHSLYHRAVGYTFDAVKIFPPRGKDSQPVTVNYREHVPPDTTACIFWLKNRKPKDWRDVRQHEVGGPGDFAQMSDDELRKAVAEEAEAIGLTGAPASAPARGNGTAH